MKQFDIILRWLLVILTAWNLYTSIETRKQLEQTKAEAAEWEQLAAEAAYQLEACEYQRTNN